MQIGYACGLRVRCFRLIDHALRLVRRPELGQFSHLAAGRSFVLGSEGLVFLAILIGVGFEMLWRLRHGTNALVRDH
jgi:hypothetical protein